MKIDFEKFPALFHKGIIVPRQNLDAEERGIYNDIVELAKTNLYYTASTVMDNVSHSYTKLQKFKNEIPDVTRGLLFVIRGNPHSIFYTVVNHRDKLTILGQVSCLSGQGGRLYGDLFGGYFLHENEELLFHSYVHLQSNDEVASEAVKIIIANELFIHFADIETKELQPSRQIWDGPTCLYNNKSKFPIKVIDSAWYTNLISSGAFKVRGHFRLQPCGEKLSKRKLIWISDFEKDGYTRKAKISNNENLNP
jgi:hypothetical protein